MNQQHEHLIERALIDVATTEITIMRSICANDFPCDMSTVVAMRMSRAIVSTLCRLRFHKPLPQSTTGLFTPYNSSQLREMNNDLDNLSKQFEIKLSTLPDNKILLSCWKA